MPASLPAWWCVPQPNSPTCSRRTRFRKKAANRTVAIFLDGPPPGDALQNVSGRKDELLGLGTREVYVHYGDGIADSKLKIPDAKNCTARNMNTVARLAAMAMEPSPEQNSES